MDEDLELDTVHEESEVCEEFPDEEEAENQIDDDGNSFLSPEGDSYKEVVKSHLETKKAIRPIASDETTESGRGSVGGSNESIREKEDEKSQDENDEGSDSGWDTDLEIEEIAPEVYDASGKNAYLKACKDIGVVPASHFLRHITSPVINMKHHGLGPQGAKAIAVALVANTSVLTLDLEDNMIQEDGGAYIAEMLKENCYITDLDLSENRLMSKGAKAVGEMLEHNSCLRKIQLRGNHFKDRDAQPFMEAMKVNYRLKELNLSHNAFREVGGEILGEGVAANESIQELDLSWNHLRRKGAIAVCRGLVENISLKKLDLSWNGFGNEGALAMAEALKYNSTIEWVNLSNNRITDEGAFVLSKGLEVNDTLKTLKLGLNPVTASGAMALLAAIQKNSKCAIDELDLQGIVINKNVTDLLTDIQKAKPDFRIVFEGSIGQFENHQEQQPTPLDIVQDYIRSHNLRVWDLFKAYDKDKNMSVSRQEFQKGIEASGIKLTPRQTEELMRILDEDDSGEIDFSELVTGTQNANQQRREERKLKMTAVADIRRNKLYAPVAEQFNNLNVNDLKRPLSPDRRALLNNMIKPDITQWDEHGHKSDKVSLSMRSLDQTLDFSGSTDNTLTKEETLLSKTIGPPRSRSPSPRRETDKDNTKNLNVASSMDVKSTQTKSASKNRTKSSNSNHLYDADM